MTGTSWSSLLVLLVIGRLLLDVGTPLLPGAFHFDGDQSADARVMRAPRAPATLVLRLSGPTPELIPVTTVPRITAPRPSLLGRSPGIIEPLRLPGLDRDPAPASDDH